MFTWVYNKIARSDAKYHLIDRTAFPPHDNSVTQAIEKGEHRNLVLDNYDTITRLLDQSDIISHAGSNTGDYLHARENAANILVALCTGKNTPCIFQNWDAFHSIVGIEPFAGVIKAFANGVSVPHILHNSKAAAIITSCYSAMQTLKAYTILADAPNAQFLMDNAKAVSELIGEHRDSQDNNDLNPLRMLGYSPDIDGIKKLLDHSESITHLISDIRGETRRSALELLAQPAADKVLGNANRASWLIYERGVTYRSSTAKYETLKMVIDITNGPNGAFVLEHGSEIRMFAGKCKASQMEVMRIFAESPKAEMILVAGDVIAEDVSQYTCPQAKHSRLRDFAEGRERIPVTGEHTKRLVQEQQHQPVGVRLE